MIYVLDIRVFKGKALPESLAYPIKFGGKASKTSEFYRKSNAFTLPKEQLLKRVVLEVKAIALWLI